MHPFPVPAYPFLYICLQLVYTELSVFLHNVEGQTDRQSRLSLW